MLGSTSSTLACYRKVGIDWHWLEMLGVGWHALLGGGTSCRGWHGLGWFGTAWHGSFRVGIMEKELHGMCPICTLPAPHPCLIRVLVDTFWEAQTNWQHDIQGAIIIHTHTHQHYHLSHKPTLIPHN